MCRLLITWLVVFLINAPVFSLDLYGHRGARGLSPENTLPAYRAVLEIGVDFIDMDVGVTKDGVVVVTHNLALNPDITKKPDGKWLTSDRMYVKNLTFNQLEQYDVGQIKPNTADARLFRYSWPVRNARIPSLAQVIRYADKATNHRIRYQIEIKTNPALPDATYTPYKMATAVAAVMKHYGVVNRSEVQAFDYRVLQALQKINPRIKTAYLTEKDQNKPVLWHAGHRLSEYNGSIPGMVKALGGRCWDPQDTMLTKKQLDDAHRLGLRVVVWHWPKVQSPPNIAMTEKLMGWGVDGIITDRPDIVRGLMAARGLPVAKAYSEK